MTNSEDISNPLSRTTPLGGRVGIAIVSIVPLVALALFLIIGFTTGGWGWAWVFFLAIPIAAIIVYGITDADFAVRACVQLRFADCQRILLIRRPT